MPNFGTIDDTTGVGGDLSSSLLDQVASLSVDTVADLPATSTNGDVKYVNDTKVYYIYNATQGEWESLGTNLTDANLKFLRIDENLNDIPDKALARQNLGITTSIDSYTKMEINVINGALVVNSSQDLSLTSPRHILFKGLSAGANCRLPDLVAGSSCRFVVENDTAYPITITSLKSGVLIKGVSSFTLDANTAETFIFNTNWI